MLPRTYYKICSELLQILPLRLPSTRRNVFAMATREQASQPGNPETAKEDTLDIARRWDAGQSGCGVLIVGLKRELHRIQAGELLRVTALDAGAAADLPAWCRLTGHRLLAANHPTYVLEKKDHSSNRGSNAGGRRND